MFRQPELFKKRKIKFQGEYFSAFWVDTADRVPGSKVWKSLIEKISF